MHTQISHAIDKIAAHGVNLDRQLCLYYSQRSDYRNDRPSLVTGNLVLASDETRHSALVQAVAKHPVIDLGEQPRSKDMLVLEDPDKDALPHSVQ